jgi:Fe-S oxidoreductase
VPVDENHQQPYSFAERAGDWCANGCVCWPIAALIRSSWSSELPEKRASLRSLIERTRNSWHASKGEYDFSHEVKEAMSGCLACKACSTQCPIKIDVPEFRSRFLQLYHTRYLRPVRDHLVATVESYAPLMARAPRPSTSLSTSRWCASSPKSISWSICRCCRCRLCSASWSGIVRRT